MIRFPISYPQAALGADIEVPTLKGPHDMNLEPGTQSGDVFRIRGGGVPDPQTGRVGDLLVEVFIETPKKLEPRQEELLRELAELEQTHVSPHRKSFLEKIITTLLFHLLGSFFQTLFSYNFLHYSCFNEVLITTTKYVFQAL